MQIFGKKLVTTRKRRYYLISEPNYYAKILMNKLDYLRLSILDLSKRVMYKFCYDHVKPRYGANTKPCYMDTNSFIVPVKNNIYKDITDVETRFDTSNFKISSIITKRKK